MDQPQVMGEIIAGILLGPSFLGLISPAAQEYLLPQSIVPLLNIIAQIGILFYMFFVGLELDLVRMNKTLKSTFIISQVSIVLPFALGLIIASKLYEATAPAGVNFLSFALFIGVSLSVTAFPVLARILTDKNMHKTKLGTLALNCAAIDDITAWCLLAFVVSFSSNQFSKAVTTVALTIIFIALMFFVVMPFIKKRLAFSPSDGLTEKSLVIVLMALLTSALTTELIGIHALFGAFLFGAIFPNEHSIAKNLHYRLYDFIRLFFLPVFFAFAGMRTKIGLVNSPREWGLCALIIFVAIVGKFGGAFIAAKFCGLKTKSSVALGFLMNTRGLVELIVLNIGLDLGVITPTLYTMLVIMALVTTLMTGPLMKLIKGHDHWENLNS